MRSRWLRLALVAVALWSLLGAGASARADDTGARADDTGARAVGACATTAGSSSDSGIGGTGFGDPDSGIGGTGHADPDDGIGGTGVLGTITGFASLCVNGLEIHYDADVPVDVDGVAAGASVLAIGQVVWVVAVQDEGSLVARSIDVLTARVGTLEALDLDAASLRVGGEEIELWIDARLLEGAGGRDALRVGERVAVSGLRRAEGRLVATRVDPAGARPDGARSLELDRLVADAPALERVVAQGYAAPERDGTSLAGLRLAFEGVRPERDERIRISGRMVEGVLRAERWQPERPERPRPAPRPEARTLERPAPQDRPEPVERPERAPRPDRIEPPPRIERPDVLRPGR